MAMLVYQRVSMVNLSSDIYLSMDWLKGNLKPESHINLMGKFRWFPVKFRDKKKTIQSILGDVG